MRGERLAAVQVAERGVVHPVEHRGGHRGDAADRDVPLAVARRAAGDEGVRQHHRPGAGRACRQVGPHLVHRRPEHRRVPAPGQPEPLAHQRRLQVRQPVHRHRPVLVRQHHRRGALARIRPQVDPGPPDQPRPDPQPAGRVVVAADEHRRHPEVRQPVQHVVEHRDRFQPRQRPVVDVSGDQHGVHALGPDHVHQVVQEGALGVVQALPVERAPEMPVGGMQQSHGPRP